MGRGVPLCAPPESEVDAVFTRRLRKWRLNSEKFATGCRHSAVAAWQGAGLSVRERAYFFAKLLQFLARLTVHFAPGERVSMDTRLRHSNIMQWAAIVAVACAGLMTAAVTNAESYQEALEEAERESPHQRERVEDPRSEALEEAGRESTHQRERVEDPRSDALEEAERESPHQQESQERSQ